MGQRKGTGLGRATESLRQEGLEFGERLVSACGGWGIWGQGGLASGQVIHITGMFVVVTVNAEILPISAVRWIVVVIVILVVDRQFDQVILLELPTTTGANPGMEAQGLLSIALQARICGASGHIDQFRQFLGTIAAGAQRRGTTARVAAHDGSPSHSEV